MDEDARGAFNINMNILNNLSSHPGFSNALTVNVSAFKETKAYFTSINEDLSKSATLKPYVEGKKNNLLAQNFEKLFDTTIKRIMKYEEREGQEQRQFVYNLIIVQLGQLLNLVSIQKYDLSGEDKLTNTFNKLTETMMALRELNINLDPNESVTGMLRSVLELSSRKPVLVTSLEKLLSVIID